MDIRDEIVTYLRRGYSNFSNLAKLFEYYGLDINKNDINDLNRKISNDNILLDTMKEEICDSNYNNPDFYDIAEEVIEKVDYLRHVDVDNDYLGQLLRIGNWWRIVEIIREKEFNGVVLDAIDSYVVDYLEPEYEDYMDNAKNLEEKVCKKKRRLY